MTVIAFLCVAGAVLAMVLAVAYQRRDIVPGRGGTMGGEMTAGLIWLLAALLGAVGSLAFMPWYFSVLVFVAVLALSFLVRMWVARLAKRG